MEEGSGRGNQLSAFIEFIMIIACSIGRRADYGEGQRSIPAILSTGLLTTLLMESRWARSSNLQDIQVSAES